MADFVAVLKKTLDGLGETTPATRAKVYDKARATIAAKLAAINPPPPAAVAERQKRALEDAIASVEREYGKPAPAAPPPSDPLAELEHLFSSIDRNKNQPNHPRPGERAAPLAPPPASSPTPAPRSEPSWQRPASPAPKFEPAAPKPAAPARADAPLAKAQPAFEEASVRSAPRHAPPPPEAEADTEDFFSADPEPARETFAEDREGRKRGYGGLIAAVVALAVIGGGGYGVWLNKDAFASILGLSGDKAGVKTVKTVPVKPAKPAQPAKPSTDTAAAQPTNGGAPSDAGETPKFTQRLTPEGKETDPGPASGGNGIGEGTSVAALTTPPPGAPAAASPAAPAEGAAPAAPPADPASPGAAADAAAQQPASAAAPAVAVGQKAIYYEEKTSSSDGTAEPGNTVWSVVQESPGGDAPPEPAIRAETTIPGKDVQLRMTIRRNTDQTLPASHIIELIFLTPDGFDGGGIDNILRFAMKGSEQDAGSPLIGVPAKIADGFFLVALNDTKADEAANLSLLRNQEWIDIPVVYKSGRRALLTMEKGIPGDKVFDEALKAWQAKTSG